MGRKHKSKSRKEKQKTAKQSPKDGGGSEELAAEDNAADAAEQYSAETVPLPADICEEKAGPNKAEEAVEETTPVVQGTESPSDFSDEQLQETLASVEETTVATAVHRSLAEETADEMHLPVAGANAPPSVQNESDVETPTAAPPAGDKAHDASDRLSETESSPAAAPAFQAALTESTEKEHETTFSEEQGGPSHKVTEEGTETLSSTLIQESVPSSGAPGTNPGTGNEDPGASEPFAETEKEILLENACQLKEAEDRGQEYFDSGTNCDIPFSSGVELLSNSNLEKVEETKGNVPKSGAENSENLLKTENTEAKNESNKGSVTPAESFAPRVKPIIEEFSGKKLHQFIAKLFEDENKKCKSSLQRPQQVDESNQVETNASFRAENETSSGKNLKEMAPDNGEKVSTRKNETPAPSRGEDGPQCGRAKENDEPRPPPRATIGKLPEPQPRDMPSKQPEPLPRVIPGKLAETSPRGSPVSPTLKKVCRLKLKAPQKLAESDSEKADVSMTGSNNPFNEDAASLSSQTASAGDASSLCSVVLSPKHDSDATSELSREFSPDSTVGSSRDLNESTTDSKLFGAFSKLKSKRWRKSKREEQTSPGSGLHFSIGHKIDSMFGSKKSKEKDGSVRSKGKEGHQGLDGLMHGETACSILPQASNGYELRRGPIMDMSDEEVNAAFKELLEQMNIKGEKLNALLTDGDMAKKRQMVWQSQKLKDTPQAATRYPIDFIHRMERALQSPEEGRHLMKELMRDMKVQLSVEKVDWIADFGNQGGIRQLLRIMRSFIESFRREDEREEDTALLLHDSVKCLKAVVNTWPGMDLCFKKDSKMFVCLVGALSVASRKPPADFWENLKFEILNLLTVVAFVNDDQFEVHGRDALLKALTEEGKRRNCARFRCIVDCIRKSEKLDVVKKALMLINIILDVRDPEDTSTEEGKAEAEEAWQMRMHWRSEFMRAGLYDCVEKLENCSIEAIKVQYETFCDNKEADFSELIGRFEQIKGDYDDMGVCFSLLLSGVKETRAEGSLLSILQHLLLVPDDFVVRPNYFRLIENCVSEIVLPKTCVDPDFRGKFEFTQDVCQLVDSIDDNEVMRQFNKRLEAATQMKNEALAKQSQYYKKMEEFAEEAALLRKHIADPNIPLPQATSCSLPPPSAFVDSASSLPSIAGVPPGPSVSPEPPKAPSGAVPPPPPPVTGGPPPPPPPPPIAGGPPPPPPPPGAGGPPPPPGMGGPPPPPPFGVSPAKPELPEYLKKKTKRTVEVPMKKIPLSSAVIKPTQISKESFWAQTEEDQFADEKLFSTLKSRYSSSRPIVEGSQAKPGIPMKKVKKPLVIQDEKTLQALAILQGSCKMPLEEWNRSILEVDEKVLNANIIEQLGTALPTADVLKKLKEVSAKSFQDMPEGEQFAATLASISALPARLDSILFMLRFSESVNDLKSGISAVIEACDEIRTSNGFRVFLEITLLFSNYMGHSSKAYKDVYGFEMSVLTKLTDTKDIDNDETLLHFLIKVMMERKGHEAQFPMNDFMHVFKASRVNADETAKGVGAIKISLNKCEMLLKGYAKQAPNDLFFEKLSPFMEKTAKPEFEILEKMHNTMNAKWSSLLKYFSFDAKKYSMEAFFADMRTFKEQYEHVFRAIEKARELKEQEEQKKRQPLKPLQANNITSPMKSGGVKIDGLLKTGKEAAGVVDEIEKFLEGGYLKGAERRTPRNTPRSRAGRAALQRQRSRCPEAQLLEAELKGIPQLEIPANKTVRVRRKGQPTYTVEVSDSGQNGGPKENAKPAQPLATDDLLKRLGQL